MADILTRGHETGFVQPMDRKVSCPVIDIHTHAYPDQSDTQRLLDAADQYGVQHLVTIATLEENLELRRWRPQNLHPAVWLDFTYIHDDPDRFVRDNVEIVERASQAGCPIIKFWFAPRFVAKQGIWLDDSRLTPIFDTMERRHLNALIHVSDPDYWFQHQYADTSTYGRKEDHYLQLEYRLAQHRGVKVIAAHMAGDPEHPDHLRRLLDEHPNLYLDTSATKWMVRELSKCREAAAEFIVERADRIVFGTDQVVRSNSEKFRYRVRYWAHQLLLETDLECPSPIPDPDAGGEAMLRGLNLPEDVLERMYWRNSARLLGIDDVPK